MPPVQEQALPAVGSRNESDSRSSQLMMLQPAVSPRVDVPAALPVPPAAEPRLSWSRAAGVAAVLAAAVLAVLALPGLDEVRARLAGVDPVWLGVAAALEVGSCLAFVVAFRGVMCRRLPWRISVRIGMAVQGANVLVPTGGAGGLAFAGWALRRTGMSVSTIARRTVTLFVTTSSVNFLTALAGGALVGFGLLSADVGTGLWAGPAAAALLVILAVSQVPRLLDRFGPRLNGRIAGPTREAVAHGLRDVALVLREKRFGAIGGALGYMFLDLAALAAAFQAIGSAPELGVLLVAYPLGQLGGLIPLPGGVGGTDGALIAVLALYGSPLAAATAGVLAYRVFQLGIPALMAAPAIGGTLRAVRSGDQPAAGCAAA